MAHTLQRLLLLLIVPMLALAGCAGSGRGVRVADEARGFLFDEQPIPGGVMPYAVSVPRALPADGQAMPCVLFLHGRGESGTDGSRQLVQGLGSAVMWNAAEWPCIVILPQKPDASAPWEAYAPALMDILARVKARWRIDEDRVYLTGLSQGGHGTWALASMYPGVFAALAPICGFPEPLRPEEIAERIGDQVPVWAFHGLSDDVVAPARTTAVIEAIRARRASRPDAGEVRMSLFEGVNHGSWDRAYREEGLAAWLLSQRRR